MLLLFRLSGGLFSWLGEHRSESRAAISVKKAQWRRELGKHTDTYSHTIYKPFKLHGLFGFNILVKSFKPKTFDYNYVVFN